MKNQASNVESISLSRVPEARYAYYRRCQAFRKNGEQCKAPAETGAHICYAHARQQAMEFRRKLELSILLAEVVRRMRARGRPEFEIADIFMDFNAIQVTLGVMAQAIIGGRIDCKTAGRLAVGLQTAAKVLRIIHRKGQIRSPQMNTDERRLKGSLTTKITKEHEGGLGDGIQTRRKIWQEVRTVDVAESVYFTEAVIIRTVERANMQRSTGPPEWAKAA
jgi:hypothetical protein